MRVRRGRTVTVPGGRVRCRACRRDDLEPVLDLGSQPAASSFPGPAELSTAEPAWPLRAWVCRSCWLVQLDDDGPEEGADGSAVIPAWSGTMERHARDFAAAILARLETGGDQRPAGGWRIVETASHGNYLQGFFRERGAATVIAEGAPAWADAAAAAGLAVEREALLRTSVPAIEARLGGPAVAVVDYYLLAHLRDPGAFLSGVRAALDPGGIAVLEFDHVLPVLAERQFDAVRHGHFSYLSFVALRHALERAGLEAFDVEELPVYGGAVRAWLQPTPGPRPIAPAVAALLERERRAGLEAIETYRRYRPAVERTQRALMDFLEEAHRQGRLVAGYGAPSRGNTLLNSCGVDRRLLPFTVDRSPAKHGRFLPGSHIPIHGPERLLEARPDVVLILTWDLAEEVQAQLPEVRAWGGRFAVPIPELRLLL